MRAGIFTFLCFSLFSKRFETIESVDLDIFSLFQYVSVSLLYNLYVSMFRNINTWGPEFSPFYVSACFETIESEDLDIFSLFQHGNMEILVSILC